MKTTKMSKLLENKQQMIHVASEALVLIGLTFYFNSQNKKLIGHIEDLAQRIEEQEDMIQNHENIIKQLVEQVNTLNHRQKTLETHPHHEPVSERPKKNVRRKTFPKQEPEHKEPPYNPPERSQVQSKVRFNQPELKQRETIDPHDNKDFYPNTSVNEVIQTPMEQEESTFIDSEEDYDNELAEELADLQDNEDLKKQ